MTTRENKESRNNFYNEVASQPRALAKLQRELTILVMSIGTIQVKIEKAFEKLNKEDYGTF